MPAQNTTAQSEETEKMVERPEHLIEQAVYAGVDLDEIEKTIINAAPLDEDRRAALWLYAEALCARHPEPRPHRFLPIG